MLHIQASNVKDELQLRRPKRVKLSEFSQSLFETEAKVGNDDSDGSSALMEAESTFSDEVEEADESDDFDDAIDTRGAEVPLVDKSDEVFYGDY